MPLLAFCHSIPMLALATTVTAIGGLVRPTLTSLITQATPRDEQGVVLGLTQSLSSVSMIIAPPLGGYLIEHGWLTAWGLVASAVVFIGLMLASGSPERTARGFPACERDRSVTDVSVAFQRLTPQSTLSTYLPPRRATIYKLRENLLEPYLCIRL